MPQIHGALWLMALAIAVAPVGSFASPAALAPGDGGAATETPDRRSGDPRVASVEPGVRGTLLAARVSTVKLPGSRILSSLDSGLPSAIELQMDLRDDQDRKIGANRVLFRIVYDLWDEAYRLQGGGENVRFADLGGLQRFLDDLPWVPIAPLTGVMGERAHRIGVVCRLHVIAPRETERLERWVAGAPDREERADGREVSIGLGDVIRFFYKGAKRDDSVTREQFSPWFVPDELPRGAHGVAAGEDG